MCGIAGLVRLDPAAPLHEGARADLERMAAAMSHRGPDADGFLVDEGVGLAFRRLSIIDVAGGDQPISNEDGTVRIVFNGEIYNYRELTEALEAKGHVFVTRSDTETLVHGYEEWGERGLLERVNGMFAFAIHDARRKRVVLARDRLGIKPLHIAEMPDGIAFCSELKSVHALSTFRREIDPCAWLDGMVLGYVPAPRTIWKHATKLEPGHFAVVEDGSVRTERYWQAPFVEQPIDLDDAADRVAELLADAVRLRLVSEVPLGCFLSGGVDSSAVVAAMVDEMGTSLNAVTVGFEDAAFDERGVARRVASHLGIEPREEVVGADHTVLDGVSATYDEPHADPSDVPTWLLCRATRRHVTVALSGDGGDELFGGYRRYAFDQFENRIRSFIPGPLRRFVFGPLGQMLPKGDRLPRPLRAKTLVSNLALDPVEAYFRSVARIAPEEAARLIAPELLEQCDGWRTIERFRAIDERRSLRDPLFRIRALDLETWLPDDILTKVDRASMAHSLEVRVPILDHRLVEFASSLPSDLLIRGGSTKHVFKHALRRTIPDDVLDRKKQGFDLPVAAWLSGPLADELDFLVSSGSPLQGMFDLDRAKTLLAEQRDGRRNRLSEVWTMLVFGRWMTTHMTAGATACAS